MKKLLAMVLVLGLASVASAALHLDYDGSVVNVVIDDGDSLIGIDLTVSSDVGALGAPTFFATFPGVQVAIDDVPGNPGRYSGGAVEAFGGGPVAGAAIIIGGFAPSELPMTVTLMNNAPGTKLNGELIGGGVLDELTIVPEPITMALMGLGGLVALRRRRA